MLNAEKRKKRFYTFLVFYFLFGIALLLILDNAVSPDFEQKHKTLLFVLKLTYMESPILLALIINNYIAKKTKTIVWQNITLAFAVKIPIASVPKL